MAFEEVSLEKVFLSLTGEKTSDEEENVSSENIASEIIDEEDDDDYTPMFGGNDNEGGEE